MHYAHGCNSNNRRRIIHNGLASYRQCGKQNMSSRLRLSWSEKHAILLHCKSQSITGGLEKIKKVSEWSVSELKLKQEPSYHTIMRILKNEQTIESWMNSHGHNRKKKWCNRSNVLDEQLRLWVIKMWERGIYLNESLIVEKGKRLQCSLNLSLPLPECTNILFSNGWIHSFKKRHNFSCHKSHGEEADADRAGAMTALPYLRHLTSQYHLNDIFNADEFGLYYTAAPTSTIGPGPLLGRKKSKERITFLVCANVDGSEYVPPLMIGRARRPRCFDGLDPTDIGIEDYDYGGKAWMNTAIFFRWLERFDSSIARTPGRKVLLFIDNCSGHGTRTNLPELNHVTIYFLPKNTTSTIRLRSDRMHKEKVQTESGSTCCGSYRRR